MFKRTFGLTEKEKREVSKRYGDILLYILEGRDIGYMSERLNLPPWQIESHMNEMLYALRREVGKRRFLKTLFIKK